MSGTLKIKPKETKVGIIGCKEWHKKLIYSLIQMIIINKYKSKKQNELKKKSKINHYRRKKNSQTEYLNLQVNLRN